MPNVPTPSPRLPRRACSRGVMMSPRRLADEVNNVLALDPELLSSQAGGDAELVLELLALFAETLPDMVGNIQDKMASGDAPGVARAAHLLKGSSGNMGAKDLYDAAAGLEIAAQACDRGTMNFWWGRLREEAGRVQLAVDEMLAQAGSA
jgi:HPt (histidine-containing phosphotransfer) domain-containing protein